MAQILGVGMQDTGLITCTVDPGDGTGPKLVSALPNGQSVGTIASADPATCTVSLDATPFVDPATPSVGSFTIVAVNPPAQPNVPINITLTILDASGNVLFTQVGTETIQPGITESIGEVFETPVAIPAPPASAKRK